MFFSLPVGGAVWGRGRGGGVLGKLFIGAWGKTRNEGKKFDFKEAPSMRCLQSKLFYF
jgi:hypothetical protein